MNIAILRDGFPHKHGHSDPARLEDVAKRAGHTAAFVSADQLEHPEYFNAELFDVLVLPYGDFFSASARENLLEFLRGGGDFISSGGYAFDNPVIKWDGKWWSRDDVIENVPTMAVDVGSRADYPYLTGEWGGCEPTTEGGNKRWTGKDAGLRLTVEPGESYKLNIGLGTNPDTASLKRRILINGSIVLEIPAKGTQFITIPVKAGASTKIEVVFDCDLWRPSDYADTPDNRELGVWVDKITLIPDHGSPNYPDMSPFDKPINMRKGKPNDFLEWEPEQLGVFDAGFRLVNGTSLRSAADQRVIGSSFGMNGKFGGWSAVGTTGSDWYCNTKSDRARLVPLLDAYDELGRRVGSAGSIMINHSGPYRGSVWAYFGVESADIFAGEDGEKLFASLLEALDRGLYIHDLRPVSACFRQGEKAEVKASVSNFGGTKKNGKIRFIIRDETGAVVYESEKAFEAAAGESLEVVSVWESELYEDDYYIVEAELAEDANPVDCMRSAFYVWNPEFLKRAVRLSYKDNYLCLDGSPTYMLGSQAFYTWNAEAGQNPLDIERDFGMMGDMGLKMARVFARLHNERFVDALVMASQRHGIAFLYEGLTSITADPEALKKETEHAASVAERYKGIQGVFYDLQNEPNWLRWGPDKPTDAAFNTYLRRIYKNNDALKSAWGDKLNQGEELGNIAISNPGNKPESVRARDEYRFMVEAAAAWARAGVEAVKSVDPEKLVTIGYLQWWPEMTIDPAATSDALDFMNRHWYGKIGELSAFDAMFALSDRRYRGKAPSMGEFGSKTFPTFKETGHNYDTDSEQELRFLHIAHYTLGMGGTFACNWVFRDVATNIFPYGVVFSDGTPKPAAKYWGAMARFFSILRPVYKAPEVYLVQPESRIGGGSARVYQALQRTANALIDANIPFGSISESDLDNLPDEAKLLIMPGDKSVTVIKGAAGREVQCRMVSMEATDKKALCDEVEAAARKSGATMEEIRPKGAGLHLFRLPMERNGEAVVVGNTSDKPVVAEMEIHGVKYTAMVEPEKQAVLVSVDGKLVAAEAQGEVTKDGKAVISADCHFFIHSLDGEDLSTSGRMMLTALRGGRLDMHRDRIDAESGRMVGGAWTPYNVLLETGAKGIQIPDPLAGEIIVLTREKN